jgi:hypothetical protein
MHKDSARIPSPCHEDWGAMSGDDQKRFCASCSKHVHDLSSMPEAKAATLLASGDVCVRYLYHARTGKIRFADAPRPSRIAASFALAAAALLGPPTVPPASAPAAGATGSEGSLLDRVGELVRAALASDDDQPTGDVAADPLLLPKIPDRTPRAVDEPAAVVDIELVAYLPVIGIPMAWPKPEPADRAR